MYFDDGYAGRFYCSFRDCWKNLTDRFGPSKRLKKHWSGPFRWNLPGGQESPISMPSNPSSVSVSDKCKLRRLPVARAWKAPRRVDAQRSLEKTFCMKSFFCNRLDIPFYKLVVKNIFRFALFYEIVIRLACFLSHNACVTTPLKMSARPLSCHVPFAVDRLRELFYFRTTWSSFRVPAKLPRTRVML